MDSIGRADLVVLALAGSDGGESTGDGHSMSKLVEELSVASGQLSQQLALAGTLHELREQGLIEATQTGTELRFSLSEDGSAHARTVRDRVSGCEIEIVEGTRQNCTVEDATAAYGVSLPQLLAQLTDGVYYPSDRLEHTVIGRESERKVCLDVFKDVRESGKGHALFLTGPGGIGKTTLTADVLAESQDGNATILQTRGRGSETGPFHPIRDLLSQLDTRTVTSELDTASEDPTQFKNQQTAQFLAFTEALTPAADEPVRILFIDDLHLADPGTLAYLSHLGTMLEEYRLCLVVSYRPAEFEPPEAFEGAFSADSGHITYLHLSPLGRNATRRVIGQTLDHRAVPEQFVDTLYDLTGGNPLFVEETVSALVEADQLDPAFEWYPDDADAVELPAAVEESVQRQVDALEPEGQTVLEWAARMGKRVSIPVLEAVIEQPDLDTETIIDGLVVAGLFERTAADILTFQSEVVLEALRLQASEAPSHHATIAAEFERRVKSERANDATTIRDWGATIASHHERAGNHESAIEWYCATGEQAMEVYAHDGAINHYYHALDLARQSDNQDALVEISEQVARTAILTAAFDMADKHITFAKERATDPVRRQRLFVLETQLNNQRSKFEQAVENATDGLAVTAGSTSQRCRLLLGRATAEDNLGQFDQAMETAESARQLANDTDTPALGMQANHLIGEIKVKQGRYESAKPHLQDALDVADQLTDRFYAGRILLVLGNAAAKQADNKRLRMYNERALEHFEAIGDPHGASHARCNLAVADRKAGNFERAREGLRDAIETYETLGDHHSVARNRGNLGSIAFSERNLDAARKYYEQALDVFEDVGEGREIALAQLRLGEVALEQRQYDRAGEYFEQANTALTEMNIRRGVAEAKLGLGVCAIERDSPELAEAYLTEALDSFESIGDRGGKIKAELAFAHLETVTKSPDVGLERWGVVTDDFNRLDPSYSVGLFDRLIRACEAQGGREIAIEWCNHAIEQSDATDTDGLATLRDFLHGKRAELRDATTG